MPHTPRTHWNNSRHWPTCHKSQADAGLPAGPLDDAPVTNRHRFLFGLLMGLLVVGPALADLWEAL
jgi:hypothetical protein